MTQKPSLSPHTVQIVNTSNSTVIEFKPNFFAFPLMLFGLRLSIVWLLLITAFVQSVFVQGILILMLSVPAIFVYLTPELFINKIILTKDNIEFKYYGFLIENASFIKPRDVNFTVKLFGEKLKIDVLNNTFMLDNTQDLPIITDEFSRLLNLEFIETVRLAKGKEVLVYRRK